MAMIETLSLDSPPASRIDKQDYTDDLPQTISAAMEEFDPLVNFSITTLCPYCETVNTYRTDLEKFSLGSLYRAQLRLFKTIHRLASHYHWSERQILATPPWRRSFYLSLIDEERSS